MKVFTQTSTDTTRTTATKRTFLQRNFARVMLGFLMLLVINSTVSFGQLLSEPFNYTAHATNGLNAQSSGAWTNLNSGDSILVASGTLTYSGITAGSGNKISYGGAGTDAYRGFTSQTTGTVYCSFLLSVTSLGSLNTTGGYTLGLLDNGTSNFGSTLWLRSSGANYNIGINPRTTAANTVWLSNTLTVNTTYLVVIATQIVSGTANDISKIWVNPTSFGASEPTADGSVTNTTGTDLTTIQRVFLRQDATTATPNLELDEMRVGTTWASVTPPSATPVITTSGTLAATNTTYGSPSGTPTSFTVSGANMGAGILVTPPAGYEVSQTVGGGSGYANSITVGSAGTISNTTVYVRLKSTATVVSSPYTGNVVCSSSGATSQNVATVSSSVSPAGLTITAGDQSKTYNTTLSLGTSSFTPTGLQNSETVGSVTLSDGGAAASATTNVGTYPITPSAATGGTFTAANYTITYTNGTLTINKANQTITFNALSDKLDNAGSFGLTATASSGLTVSYVSGNTGVVTISGSTATIVGSGDALITASQAGDGNWNAATPVAQNQHVSSSALQNQTITFTQPAAVTYGDADFQLTASTDAVGLSVTYASSDPTVASVTTGGMVTLHKNGTTDITASQAGNGTYNAATPVTRTLTVNVKTLTVTGAVANNKVYDGNTDAVIDITTTPATLNGIVGSDQVTLNGTTGTFASANAGTAIAVTPSLSISNTDASKYTLTQPSLSANITQQSQTVAFTAAVNVPARFFTSAKFKLFATASSGLPVTFSSSPSGIVTIVGDSVTVVAAGTTTITASQAGNVNYSAAANVDSSLTINKSSQTITFATPAAKVTTDGDFQLAATANSGLTVSYSGDNPAVATVSSTGLVHITGAGSVNITASQAGNANYNAATDVTRVQAVTYPLIAAWDFFGQTSPATFAATTFNGNLVSASGANNITRGAGAASSSAANSFRSTGFQNNGIATSNTDYFQVTLKSASGNTLSISSISANLSGTASFGATPGVSNQFAYSLDGTTFTLIGSPVITIGTTVAIPLIDVTGISALQNLPPTTTVTIRYYASGQTTTGGWGFFSTASGSNGLSIGGAVNPIVAPVITSATTDNATVGVPYSYQIVASNGPTGYSSTTTLPVNGITLNGTSGVISGTPTTAGSTTINMTAANSGGSDSKDLVITVAKGNQTISGVTPSSITKTFGDADYSLGTVTASSGLTVTYSSDDPLVATVNSSGLVHIVGGGSTTIRAQQGGNANWNAATDATQALTVNKANQSITFNTLSSVSSTGGDYNLTATSSSGLAVTFTGSDNNTATVTSGGLVHIVVNGAGSVDFTAHQAGNDNYNAATDVTRTQTITNGNLITPVITFNALAAVTYGDAPLTLTATSNSPVTITYVSSDPTVASISGNTVTILKNGTTTITASQAGDGTTYNAAADVSQSLTVNQKTLTIINAVAHDKRIMEVIPLQ